MKITKKTANLIININIIISIILILIIVFKYITVKEEDNIKFSNEYKNIDTNNKFIYKDIDEIIEILTNGTGIIFFGFPECIWCQEYVIYLNEIINEENIDNVYYLNIKNDRNKNTQSYNKLINILSDYLIENDNNIKQLYVPTTIIVNNGEIIYNNNETSSINESISPNEYWNESKINEFKNNLRSNIKKIE